MFNATLIKAPISIGSLPEATRQIFYARTESFVQEYGILFLTCMSLAVLGIALLYQTKDSVDYSRLGSNRSQLLDSAERLS